MKFPICSWKYTSGTEYPGTEHSPPVRAVLPLCREILFLWSRNPNAVQKATVGRIGGKTIFAPAGAEILLPLGSS